MSYRPPPRRPELSILQKLDRVLKRQGYANPQQIKPDEDLPESPDSTFSKIIIPSYLLDKRPQIMSQIKESAEQVEATIFKIEIRLAKNTKKGVAALIYNSKPQAMIAALRSTHF